VTVSNREVGVIPSLVTVVILGAVMLFAVFHTPWQLGTLAAMSSTPTTYAIGNAFLGEYVLPFEVASLVLLAALVGAIVISRHETRE